MEFRFWGFGFRAWSAAKIEEKQTKSSTCEAKGSGILPSNEVTEPRASDPWCLFVVEGSKMLGAAGLSKLTIFTSKLLWSSVRNGVRGLSAQML